MANPELQERPGLQPDNATEVQPVEGEIQGEDRNAQVKDLVDEGLVKAAESPEMEALNTSLEDQIKLTKIKPDSELGAFTSAKVQQDLLNRVALEVLTREGDDIFGEVAYEIARTKFRALMENLEQRYGEGFNRRDIDAKDQRALEGAEYARRRALSGRREIFDEMRTAIEETLAASGALKQGMYGHQIEDVRIGVSNGVINLTVETSSENGLIGWQDTVNNFTFTPQEDGTLALTQVTASRVDTGNVAASEEVMQFVQQSLKDIVSTSEYQNGKNWVHNAENKIPGVQEFASELKAQIGIPEGADYPIEVELRKPNEGQHAGFVRVTMGRKPGIQRVMSFDFRLEGENPQVVDTEVRESGRGNPRSRP